ncbi:MAG: class I SAM-dependent methyltransferase [Pyrinomonadaceae bacterium]|nr:class I SAM-dependent methyltransferase [Pyrinomonadaceae bacterium]
MTTFENQLNSLDISLFEKISSQTTKDDKRSLLAIQNATREIFPNYNYLEIGSHLGGSIQPHLVDEKCAKIFSIDKRPLVQPDERGVNYGYPENSTQRMLDLLSQISTTEKIKTIDGETSNLDKKLITEKAQLCFIDGEHTDKATKIDFDFCLELLDNSGAIIFHDSYVIYNAIADCVKTVKDKGLNFQAYSLPSVVFVIEIGDFPLHKNQHIQQLLLENHKSYLFSLQQNDEYRRFTTSFPFNYMWKLGMKLGVKF